MKMPTIKLAKEHREKLAQVRQLAEQESDNNPAWSGLEINVQLDDFFTYVESSDEIEGTILLNKVNALIGEE